MKVIVLKDVAEDLEEGRLFYDRKEPGIGDYFFDSLISDLESLRLYAGTHYKRFGLHRMLSRRFPFAIYYETFMTVRPQGSMKMSIILDNRLHFQVKSKKTPLESLVFWI